MASILNLDMKDPAVAEMVGSWADNTDYTVTMTIRTGSGNQRNVTQVVSDIVPDEETAPESEEGAGTEESPGPAAVKQAMETSGVMKRAAMSGGASATAG